MQLEASRCEIQCRDPARMIPCSVPSRLGDRDEDLMPWPDSGQFKSHVNRYGDFHWAAV